MFRLNVFGLLFILMILGVELFSQAPLFYLNSKPVDLTKVYLNPSRVDSVNFLRRGSGEVLISTKNLEFSYYSLNEILIKEANVNSSVDTFVLKINGNLIEDTTSIQIDDTYYVYVNTDRLSNVKYLPGKYRNLILVNIELEREKRKPLIKIRGNQEILDRIKDK